MATTLNVNSSFVGVQAGEIFVQAFKKSDTISKGAITVLPNVIGSGYLPKLSYTSGLVDYACGWAGNGTVDYSDKEVATKKFKIEHELCKDEFHQTFQAQAAGLFGANAEIPATIQEAILLAMVNNMGALVDTQIWQGAGTSGQFAGLLAKFVADADVIDITASTATIKSNVISQLDAVYNLVPDAVIEETDLIFAVAPNVAKAYKQAQAALNIGTPVGDKELDYLGVKMVSIAGLPSSSILAYRVKNVAFLTGLEADLNNVTVKDMDESDLSGNIRTKMVFNAGVGYSFGNQIVYSRL